MLKNKIFIILLLGSSKNYVLRTPHWALVLKKLVFLVCSSCKKRVFGIALILFFPVFLYSFKIKATTKDNKPLTFQLIFDTGFSAKGISDSAGITDYETVFIKPAFHFQELGIGFVFDFKFRFILGQFSFLTNQWYIKDDGLNTFFLYLDKIDYIKYGSFDSPFYFNMGKNPVLTFGTGLIVKNFHNHAFIPSSRELGAAFKFDGNNLYKFKKNTFPFDATIVLNDILDPDIFCFDYGFDVFKFTKHYEKFSLRVGQTGACDINATESNRLSSISDEIEDMTSHRNLTTTKYNLFTSFPLFTSIYLDFLYPTKYVRLNIFNENGLLFDFLSNNQSFNFGFAIKIGVEARFIDLKKSGFLLGIMTGFIVESPHFTINNFSSNYEVVRQKQYNMSFNDNDYTYYIMAGLGLYGFHDRLKFLMSLTMPIVSKFTCKFSISFTLEDTLVPGLWITVLYETGVNTMYIEGGSGEGISDSLTRDFRFSAELGYKFYGAKLSVLIGIQRPGYVIPYAEEGIINNTYKSNPYIALANGEIVPDTVIDYNDGYNWQMDLNKYFNDLEKFVSLEISFVF